MSAQEPHRSVLRVGGADSDLDQLLSHHLDEFNRAATPGQSPARELTVQRHNDAGELLGGISGWTWGDAGAMGMVWVRNNSRGVGVGGLLLGDFEAEAKDRGCTHLFVTSFTFQAPGFYERHGYQEIFRWDGVPTPEHADAHFRKDLT